MLDWQKNPMWHGIPELKQSIWERDDETHRENPTCEREVNFLKLALKGIDPKPAALIP